MTIQVRRNIPVPPRTGAGRPRTPKYPIETLDVGECLYIPKGEVPAGGRNALRSAVNNYIKHYGQGAKYRVAEFPGEEGAFGIWRLE